MYSTLTCMREKLYQQMSTYCYWLMVTARDKGMFGCRNARNFAFLVVKLPAGNLTTWHANTTHLLQPCDQSVNKSFQRTVRNTRDELFMMSHVPWANSAFKIKLAVAGHRALTPEVARKSFVEAGLWPMNYQFLDRFTPCQVSDNA